MDRRIRLAERHHRDLINRETNMSYQPQTEAAT
ncbi:2-hydroxy-6-oxo-6-phenylhexa-2,4-dienoate hydrolase, partial [Klebsiella pneumoniae]